MKKNKGKGLAVGNKVIQTRDDIPIQTYPPIPFAMKLVPPVSSEKRKTMSKKLDMSNLPNLPRLLSLFLTLLLLLPLFNHL